MKHVTYAAGLLALSSLALAPATAFADYYGKRTVEYEVTITNITSGQVFSPPIIATHQASVAFFEAGEPALDELALIAEAGDTGPFAALLESLPQVGSVVTTAAPVPPGGSITVNVESSRRFSRVSIAGMLVNTNDAFFAIDTQSLPRFPYQKRRYTAIAYDAGSEANNENCGFIPGPACPEGSGNDRDEAGAEGFVFVSSGVHGIGDLNVAETTWQNPVAKVVIKRVW